MRAHCMLNDIATMNLEASIYSVHFLHGHYINEADLRQGEDQDMHVINGSYCHIRSQAIG